MNGTILLQGIVGSTAYGLAHPDSDVDRLGMYAAPTVTFHGLHPPIGKAASTVTTNPDVALHEAGKYAALAMGCNPTVTELMWLDADLIETNTELGGYLTTIRSAFLSAQRVRDAYLGYATQQFHRLENRDDGTFSSDTQHRTAKHARHLMRLLTQGLALYRTGTLPIRLSEGAVATVRHFGEQVAAGHPDLAKSMLGRYEVALDTARSPLPDRPDEDRVERWLRSVRHLHYTWPGQ